MNKRTIMGYSLAGLAVLTLGIALGASTRPEPKIIHVPRPEYRYLTPETCKKALEIDQEIFKITGEAVGSQDFDAGQKKLQPLVAKRIINANKCLES